MNQAEREHYIREYLNGQETPEGKALFDEWADRLFASAQFMDSLSPAQVRRFEDEMWAAIRRRTGLDGTETAQSAPESFREVHRSGRPTWLKAAVRYGLAASVAVALGLGYWTARDRLTVRPLADRAEALRTVRVPVGGRLAVTLTDGTRIVLNAGSTLRYPETLTGSVRQVFLEGEGFFDVTHNPEKPFIVRTGALTTTVRGTTFNVSAYPGESVAHVTLLTGKVDVATGRTRPVVLRPGERVTYRTETHELAKETLADPAQATTWQGGGLVFRRAPLGDIARQLERQYGVRVRLGRPALERCTVVATFRNATLEEVLTAVCPSINATYQIHGKEVTINGEGCR